MTMTIREGDGLYFIIPEKVPIYIEVTRGNAGIKVYGDREDKKSDEVIFFRRKELSPIIQSRLEGMAREGGVIDKGFYKILSAIELKKRLARDNGQSLSFEKTVKQSLNGIGEESD